MVVPFVANLIDGLAREATLETGGGVRGRCFPGPDQSGVVFCCFVIVISFHWALGNLDDARLLSKNVQLVVRNVSVPSLRFSRQQKRVPGRGWVICLEPEVRVECQVRTSCA
ncbi:hypothetical protein DPMN_115795 [Dreissena polymorpha]|uniref:Uncharacterized protein n=1 Tax=Dreissena polymorpha TaxID=45954 RepID=A0A9D4KMK6_DREPO|nr:hypothetical protein DPMN_115795 [Dreissena polymorpha]